MSSAMKSSVPNPYEPPALVESETVSILPVLPEDRWCELDVQLVSFHRGWCERRILLGGSIPADIIAQRQVAVRQKATLYCSGQNEENPQVGTNHES